MSLNPKALRFKPLAAAQDVEDLPEKEEVVIWVELTAQQRAYYRAIYGKQIGTLLSGVSAKNLPGLRNIAMELRKVRAQNPKPYV